ncbi:hypothetical protein SAMN05661093_10065 [Kibdelosporangium aridum]|uniref:Uncharacterized protein n=1 Tax=Kibdelosporangium aridum TaxID=2030 RepID=A0A1Y5YAW2_KIBAR|nr:hypothetical protein SAMN05661093_10065 [Kibdelosporangium aridum]
MVNRIAKYVDTPSAVVSGGSVVIALTRAKYKTGTVLRTPQR